MGVPVAENVPNAIYYSMRFPTGLRAKPQTASEAGLTGVRPSPAHSGDLGNTPSGCPLVNPTVGFLSTIKSVGLQLAWPF